MKKLLSVVLLLFLLVLAACTESEDSGTADDKNVDTNTPSENDTGTNSNLAITGGSITIATNSEPANLNPFIWATTSDTNVTHMIFDSLVIPDEELKMIGSLAESWKVSEDGKEYTFNLHKDVKWHDGEAFTADDVAFTFTSIADGTYDAGAYWRVDPVVGAAEYKAGEADKVAGIEVIDEYTIKFITKEAYAPFISGLFIGIVPKHILGDIVPGEWEKHESNRSPIGTGPFKFTDWKTGQYIKVEANKEYFNGAPKLDSIYIRFGDANTMLASFMSKDIDITSVPVSEVPVVGSLDYADLITQSTLSVYYVGFNAKNDHFASIPVRQAMAHAINKEAIVQSILGEYGQVANDVFPSNHWSHNPNLPEYNYDLVKANELMEAAGYKKNSSGMYEKNGQTIKFILEVPTGNQEREKTATILKQLWEEFGVSVDIQAQDFATLVTKLLPTMADGKQREVTKDDFAAYILGFGIEADPDEYRSYFGSSYMPPNGYNFVGYSDPTMDKLLEGQTKEIDFDKRQQLIWDVGKKLAEDEIWIPLYEQKNPFVFNKRVAGFAPDYRGFTFNAKNWSLSE